MRASKTNSQNPRVPSTLPSFNYDSYNSNQAYRFSTPPSLPPHAMIPKQYPNQKRKIQQSYQPNCSSNSSYAPRYSSVRHPYSPRRQASSYQNSQLVYPPIQHGPQSPNKSQRPSVAHSNGFSHHHRFSNPQYRHFLPNQTNSFHCESCDKGFATEEKYNEHVAEHMTCDRDGCSFTAHPKIVEKHVIMQHNTGLFKRIVRGNNPEEIGKWISERKKQYPTSKKIEEKHQQKEAMDKRGERYNSEESKRPLRNCSFNNRGRRNYNSNSTGERFNQARRPNLRDSRSKQTERRKGGNVRSFKHDHVEPSDDDFVRNLPRFLGTAHFDSSIILKRPSTPHDEPIAQSYDSSIIEDSPAMNFFFDEADLNQSDDDNDVDSSTKCVQAVTVSSKELPKAEMSDNQRPNLVSAISCSSMSLIQCYNSSESDNEESSSETTNGKITVKDSKIEFEDRNTAKTMVENISNEYGEVKDADECPNEENDDDKPEEISSKLSKHLEHDFNAKIPSEDSSAPSSEKKQTRKRKRHKDEKKEEPETPATPSLGKFPEYKRYRKPTLLEKLLAPEIRHERNVILQCIRYVVENKFFGLDNS